MRNKERSLKSGNETLPGIVPGIAMMCSYAMRNEPQAARLGKVCRYLRSSSEQNIYNPKGASFVPFFYLYLDL